jgi:hypothetical protein
MPYHRQIQIRDSHLRLLSSHNIGERGTEEAALPGSEVCQLILELPSQDFFIYKGELLIDLEDDGLLYVH